MQRKEIEKVYIKKINELKKHDKSYFEQDSPIISDKDYDIIKQEIFNFEKKYILIKLMNSKDTIRHILNMTIQPFPIKIMMK